MLPLHTQLVPHLGVPFILLKSAGGEMIGPSPRPGFSGAVTRLDPDREAPIPGKAVELVEPE